MSQQQFLRFVAYFPAAHILRQERIAELLLCPSAELDLLARNLLIAAQEVRFLNVFDVNVAADDAEAVLQALVIPVPLLLEAVAHLKQFLREDAALDLELEILLAPVLARVLLVVVEALVDVPQAVLIELVELEQCLPVAAHLLLLRHQPQEVDLLAYPPQHILLHNQRRLWLGVPTRSAASQQLARSDRLLQRSLAGRRALLIALRPRVVSADGAWLCDAATAGRPFPDYAL